jgi:hypothetical protein
MSYEFLRTVTFLREGDETRGGVEKGCVVVGQRGQEAVIEAIAGCSRLFIFFNGSCSTSRKSLSLRREEEAQEIRQVFGRFAEQPRGSESVASRSDGLR